jgi:GNAT superfamily N-acetyltransferase
VTERTPDGGPERKTASRHAAERVVSELPTASRITPLPDHPAPRRSTLRSALGTSVRKATLGDLPVVVELRLALLQENGDHAVYGRLRADARERAFELFGAQLRSPAEAIFLAERAEEVLGILRCVDTPNSPLLHPDRYCYVSSVYVRPAARRTGVLTALLGRATEWCERRGLREMRLHNVPGGVAASVWDAEAFDIVEEVRRKAVGG